MDHNVGLRSTLGRERESVVKREAQQTMHGQERRGEVGFRDWAVKRHPRDPWNALPHKITPPKSKHCYDSVPDHEAD